MKEEKQSKMKKSTKYLIIGVLVLFLSILGASVAYYLARVSGTLSGRAAGTELELTITPLSTSANGDLIPLDNDLETLNLAAKGYGNEGSTFDSTKACIDINGYSVCQIYRIRVTNNGSVPLTMNGTVTLYGQQTPNIDCAKMDDEVNITNNNSCMGTNTLASNVVLPANNHLDYYVMVYIKNLDEPQYDKGEFNGTVTFTTIDGKKVKGRFKREETLVEHITKLYNDATKTEVTNNNIIYNYATNVGLMNDRLGGTTESLDGGNIRYYGAEPNNYIVIGDKYEEDIVEVKGNWEAFPKLRYNSSEECLGDALLADTWDSSPLKEESGYETFEEFCSTTTTVVVPKDTSILWRIIGVFDGKLRIRRENNIGPYSYDTSSHDVNVGYGINEWSQADLMKLLNPGYNNNQDLNNSNETVTVNNSLYWNSGSGTCYNKSNNHTTECDFTNTGLSDDAKENIIDQTFYLGGFDSYSVYVNQAYANERGNNVFNNTKSCYGQSYCNDTVERTLTWTGKVGLIYPSDFGYAADLSDSNCQGALNSFENCGANWMNKGSSMTISPMSDYTSRSPIIVFISGDNNSQLSPGYSFANIWNDLGGWPVVTLNPNLIIDSGDGSRDNPYVLEGANYVPGEPEYQTIHGGISY